MSDAMLVDVSELKGVAAVTGIFLFEYYVYIYFQAGAYLKTEARLGKKGWNRFDHSAKLWEWADRTFNNIMEQSIPFLTTMWVHAIFVDPAVSIALGGFYVGFRTLYPFLWVLGNGKSAFILMSTIPGYVINLGFLSSTVFSTLFESPLPFVSSSSTAVRSVATFGMGVTAFIAAVICSRLISTPVDAIFQRRWKAQSAASEGKEALNS